MTEVVNILKLAKTNIETHGWVQGAFGREECGFCAAGAIQRAADTVVAMAEDNAAQRPNWHRLVDDAEAALQKSIERRNIIQWNDSLQRTKADVLLAFDLAIGAAESTQ